MQNEPLDQAEIKTKLASLMQEHKLSKLEAEKLLIQNEMTIYLYNPKQNKINILFKDGSLKDFADATDQWNISALGHPVTKHYVCFPK